ncbi:MAG: hypothetical protein KGL74_05870 [Elusimicrobia bacterium]|nr:hypothetical protein [Elusimicrobiota bacterium]
MIALLVAAALGAAGPARAALEAAECPSGTHRILTDNPYNPFKCVKAGADEKSGFESVVGPKGFATRPRCPHGTRPVAAPDNALQPYHCVRVTAADADPELAPIRGEDDAPPPEPSEAEADPLTQGCPPGKRKVRTNDPLRPFECVVQASRVRVIDEGSYTRFSIPHQLSFEYPRSFRVQDEWKEDVPTLYLKLDESTAGKPVTMTVTKYDQSQTTYQEMDAAITRDVEWQGAKDGGKLPLAGLTARVTYVAGDTRSIYLPVSKESYYSFVYSAPADTYDNYLPAFNRLLKTLRLDRMRR